MKTIMLYSDKPPRGRCLFVAKALAAVTDLPSNDCLLVAEDLFMGKRRRENPISLAVADDADLSGLKVLAADYGFAVGEESDVVT